MGDERAVYMHEFSRRASKAFALRKQKGSLPVSYVRKIAATTTMDRSTTGTIEPQHSLHAFWCETQLWVFSGFCRVGFPLAGKASDVPSCILQVSNSGEEGPAFNLARAVRVKKRRGLSGS